MSSHALHRASTWRDRLRSTLRIALTILLLFASTIAFSMVTAYFSQGRLDGDILTSCSIAGVVFALLVMSYSDIRASKNPFLERLRQLLKWLMIYELTVFTLFALVFGGDVRELVRKFLDLSLIFQSVPAAVAFSSIGRLFAGVTGVAAIPEDDDELPNRIERRCSCGSPTCVAPGCSGCNYTSSNYQCDEMVNSSLAGTDYVDTSYASADFSSVAAADMDFSSSCSSDCDYSGSSTDWSNGSA